MALQIVAAAVDERQPALRGLGNGPDEGDAAVGVATEAAVQKVRLEGIRIVDDGGEVRNAEDVVGGADVQLEAGVLDQGDEAARRAFDGRQIDERAGVAHGLEGADVALEELGDGVEPVGAGAEVAPEPRIRAERKEDQLGGDLALLAGDDVARDHELHGRVERDLGAEPGAEVEDRLAALAAVEDVARSAGNSSDGGRARLGEGELDRFHVRADLRLDGAQALAGVDAQRAGDRARTDARVNGDARAVEPGDIGHARDAEALGPHPGVGEGDLGRDGAKTGAESNGVVGHRADRMYRCALTTTPRPFSLQIDVDAAVLLPALLVGAGSIELAARGCADLAGIHAVLGKV